MMECSRRLCVSLAVADSKSWPDPAYELHTPEVNAYSRVLVEWLSDPSGHKLSLSLKHVWDVCDVWLTTTAGEMLTKEQRTVVVCVLFETFALDPSLLDIVSPDVDEVMSLLLSDVADASPEVLRDCLRCVRGVRHAYRRHWRLRRMNADEAYGDEDVGYEPCEVIGLRELNGDEANDGSAVCLRIGEYVLAAAAYVRSADQSIVSMLRHLEDIDGKPIASSDMFTRMAAAVQTVGFKKSEIMLRGYAAEKPD